MDEETQQRIDMMQIKVDELEAKVLEQMVAFTTALKLIADLMEQKKWLEQTCHKTSLKPCKRWA